MQISELEEWREKAYHSAKHYKEWIKRWHDKRIKKNEFNPGIRCYSLTLGSTFGHKKLRSKWDGPFKVVATSPHGAITLESDEGNIFKVNDQRLKLYYEPDMQELKELDIIEFITF